MSFPEHVYRKDDLERRVLIGRVNGKWDWGKQTAT